MAGRRSRRSCSKPRTAGVRLSSAASPARRWLVRSETRREAGCSWWKRVGMPERLVGSRIVALHQRIAALHQQVAAEPVQAVEVLPEFLNDLYTALEALHVADEDMQAQLQGEIAERQRADDKARRAEAALRSAREQLRQLATHLQNAQEQERAYIARELHDDLAQALTSLRLDVSWLAGRALTAPAVWRERLTSIAVTI